MTATRIGPALALLMALGASSAPEQVLAAAVEPSPGSSAASAPRRLTLREALELALRNDPAVPSAVAMRERSDVAVLRAQLDRFSLRVDSFLTEQWRASNLGGRAPQPYCATFLPSGRGSLILTDQGDTPSQAECEAQMGQYFQPSTISQSWQGQLNMAANLQVPLFSGFRVTSNVNRARHLRDSSVATVHNTERMVALAALRAYWTVRRLEARQQVSEAAITRYTKSVQVVTARVRAGLAAPGDINRMETRRQSEMANQADLTGSAAEARAQLAVALGLGGTPLVLVEPLESLPPPPSRPEEVETFFATALRERQDLRAAHLSTLAAADFVRFQLSNYYPQLSLSSLLQFSNNPYDPLVGARSANTTANPFTNITGSIFFGGTLSINLFDTLNTWTGVRDARLEHKRLTVEERRLGRAIESEVRTLHARLLHYYALREPLQRTCDIARDNLEILQQRYRRGDVMILDFIDAQVELLNAELSLTSALTTIAQTWGELYLATGRLPS